MSRAHEFLTGQPIANSAWILSLIATTGLMLAAVWIRSIGLGVAGVLFSGIAYRHFGFGIPHGILEFACESGADPFRLHYRPPTRVGFFAALRKYTNQRNALSLSSSSPVWGSETRPNNTQSPTGWGRSRCSFSDVTPHRTSPNMNLTSASSHPSSNSAVHHPVMLVVDDEPLIRELLVMMLRMRGCKVFSAQNGAEALALAKGFESGTIDVLFTDLCMPGMSGTELAAELHETRPEIKTIFTSGYSVEEMMAMGLQVPEAFCLPKPFQPGAIDQAIDTALARGTCLPLKLRLNPIGAASVLTVGEN